MAARTQEVHKMMAHKGVVLVLVALAGVFTYSTQAVFAER